MKDISPNLKLGNSLIRKHQSIEVDSDTDQNQFENFRKPVVLGIETFTSSTYNTYC